MPRKATTPKIDTTVEADDMAKNVSAETTKKIVPKDIDPNTIVLVKNGFNGRLVYISSRTSEEYVWDFFGDEQEMELRELRNIKSSAKKFYEKNWFLFDKDNSWVIPYLGLEKFYKNALKLEDFDDIFAKSPEEIEATISKLSNGQKNSLTYRARELVLSKKIDSLKVIDALEKALGVDLIEK